MKKYNTSKDEEPKQNLVVFLQEISKIVYASPILKMETILFREEYENETLILTLDGPYDVKGKSIYEIFNEEEIEGNNFGV